MPSSSSYLSERTPAATVEHVVGLRVDVVALGDGSVLAGNNELAVQSSGFPPVESGLSLGESPVASSDSGRTFAFVLSAEIALSVLARLLL